MYPIRKPRLLNLSKNMDLARMQGNLLAPRHTHTLRSSLT